jgi:bacillithiol biosynthesis deacetylase BshB1
MFSEIKKVNILAFGVHPDDVELSCIGTLMKQKDLGYTFGLCDLTQGELGSRGSGPIRLTEAANAAQHSGASFRVNLNLPDGFITHDKDTIIKIAAVIRESKPELVLANSLDDRHPDHGRAAKIVQDACFYSGLIKIEILNQNNEPLPPHRPNAVYHYIQDKMLTPDFVVDISDYIDKKVECIQKFKTQFYTGQEMDEPMTPISGKDFLEYIKAKDKVFGRSVQAAYAEGFNYVRTPAIHDLFDLK